MGSVNSGVNEGSRAWYWPLSGFTKWIVALAVTIAVFVNLPAVEVPHASLSDGKYGPHFGCIREYEHGWPLRYAIRDSYKPITPQPLRAPYAIERSAWLPWDEARCFDLGSLVFDVSAAFTAIFFIAIAAQWWRSRRRLIWQLRIADFLALLTVIGVLLAWIAEARLRQIRENRLIEALAKQREQEGTSITPFSVSYYVERDAAVPAWLPKSYRENYRSHFGHVVRFNADGDARLATRFQHLLVLDRPEVNANLAAILQANPQLEAIDWCKGGTYNSEKQNHGGLEKLPAMPNLRGINLYETDADDADLAWLAKCPNLERICLFDTEITDAGLRHLTALRRLRILDVESSKMTNRACEIVAQITSLEELYVGGHEITEEGVLALSALHKLRELRLHTSASPEAIAELKQRMPRCAVNEE